MIKKYSANLLFILFTVVFLSACHRDFYKLQKNGTTEEKYKAAIDYYNEADYYRAGLLLEEITPLLRGDSTAEKAQLYNAYCNFYQGSLQMSSFLFKTFYSTYANSPYAEEAFYMYAYSMFKDAPDYNLDQTSTLTAIDALQTFINTYPDSKYKDQCSENLKDLRKRLELKAYEKAYLYYKTSGVTIANYKAAVIAIDNFRKDFPDSGYNEELSYVQVKSEFELAENSFFIKQHERYELTLKFYETFIDKYPNSKYVKELSKIYVDTQEKLAEVIKQEGDIEKMKEENKRVQEEGVLGKN